MADSKKPSPNDYVPYGDKYVTRREANAGLQKAYSTSSMNAKDAAKRAAAAKVAKMKKNPANYTQKGVYGFDGMQGQTGPESKLKGK